MVAVEEEEEPEVPTAQEQEVAEEVVEAKEEEAVEEIKEEVDVPKDDIENTEVRVTVRPFY